MQASKPQIFLFHGEEDFLIDEKIRELKARFGNQETLDSENLTLESLSSALCSHSLFGGEKLIEIRDAADQDELISRLENIAPGTTVVFRLPDVDKRSKFFKWVDAHGAVEEFRAFAPWEQHELAGWIKDRTRRGGKKMSEGAARLLIEICGSSLRLLANEIEKLITYVGEREEVREEDVEALASPGEISAFALLDALRAKDLGRSLSLFQVLARNGQDLFSLLGLIATQIRLMLQIKSLPEREREPGRVARVVRGSPYFIRRCSDNLGRFTLEELKEDLSRLAETSLQLKTGAQQPVVFELLLASLCLPAGRHGGN